MEEKSRRRTDSVERSPFRIVPRWPSFRGKNDAERRKKRSARIEIITEEVERGMSSSNRRTTK